MKKLSKKQKIIILISIITIIIIVGIVIGANAIIVNIANGEYNSSNSGSNNGNLLPEYIKKGITLGGVTGTLENIDTSDATATPCDIARGKTAYVNGEKITGRYMKYESTLGKVTGNETTNTTVNDIYGNKVVVPAGFKVVNPNDNVPDGIVIEDVSAGNINTKGSQFVWIPVGNVYTDFCENYETIILGRYSFSTTGQENLVQSAEKWEDQIELTTDYGSNFAELSSSSYGNSVAKNLGDFITKVLTSKGFYIGRYELGDALATASVRQGTTNVSYPNNPVACKSGIYPYTYINQIDASDLCKNMYVNSNFESDLVNSYVWDTTLVFIQKFSGDVNYSQQRGRNTLQAIQKCGESILDYNLDEGDNAHDIRCNIYDIAGNVSEWTTETCTNAETHSTWCGGNYDYVINDFSSSRYSHGNTVTGSYLAARPILYLIG